MFALSAAEIEQSNCSPLKSLRRTGLIAPFGLHDLFALNLRWNPALVSYDIFKQRIESKQWLQQWRQLH
ncbi:hypothetical protein F895_03778 [Acinetobacter sp. CIP 64.2]|nr:hypothetical protein F895_03778 [Acinetobacter sp. CIP 64.2]